MAISFSQRQYWRFLYKAPISTFYTTPATAFEKSADDGDLCVCVCQPLGQGFPTATSTPTFYPQFHRQGGKASGDKPCPTKLSRWRGSTQGRFGVYLPQLLQKLSNPPCLIHGGCMFPPINLFPAAELVTASPVQIDFATTWKQCSTIHLRRLFHLAVLRLSSHRGN